MRLRKSDQTLHDQGQRPSPGQCLAALAIVAIVVIVVIVVTRDAGAVTVVAAMILLLGWFAATVSGDRERGGHDLQG